MPGPATVSAYKLIRSFWPQKAINEMMVRRDKALGMIRKDTNFVEKVRYIGAGYAEPQGLAGNFADAKQYKTPSKAVEFAIEPVSYYGATSIDGSLFRKVKYGGDKALVVNPIKRDSKNLVEAAQRDFSWYLHGNGGGSRGIVSSVSGTELTLVTRADGRRYFPGMTIQASDGGQSVKDGTSGTVTRAGAATLLSVKYTSATVCKLVSSLNWADQITGIAANDHLFRAGTVGSVIYGFGAWNPAHTGAPGTFLGVNRDLAPDSLAGVYLNDTSLSLRQTILRLARMVYDNGGQPDTVFLSTAQWETLQFELLSAGNLSMTKVPAAPIGKFNFGIEYDAIAIMGPAGMLKVVALADMPDTICRVLTLETWVLGSTGDLVHWDDDATPDGMMLEDAADAREMRLVSDSQLYCEAPGWNGSAVLQAA